MQISQRRLFLEKFSLGTNSETEHQQFVEWLKTASASEIEATFEEYNKAVSENFFEGEVNLELQSQIEAALNQHEIGKKTKSGNGRIIIPQRYFFSLAVASLIICISVLATQFALRTKEKSTIAKASPQKLKNVGAPGENKAILTLSDGSTIILDDTKNGLVVKQAGVQITKLANGQLVYKALKDKPIDASFNTLTTPSGGQFKLTLPDGSEVWLNAVSSIKYPAVFIGNERKVEISGEAYFEIAHNIDKPFKVIVNGMEVRVLGTHFNINAYNDEATVKTTLLEGIVSLTNDYSTITIKPGQQAQVGNSKVIKVLDNVDVDQEVAWKNGYFSFYQADLPTVMRQIARWYDLKVSYEGKISTRKFGGKIDRNSNAAEVLKVLEESKVHFKLEEKKIIVRQQ